MPDERLRAGLAERIDRSQRIQFTFDGRDIEGHPGDTIGSALAANGVSTLSRSFKYHRPRGLLCAAGRCPNCLVNVDGTPSVRACVEPALDGMAVTSQNAWPSLRFDLVSLSDRFDRFLPIGFYYKVFHRPRFMWPFFEHILRRIAGLGVLDATAHPERVERTRHLHADVAIVGGGPAGCLAALEAAAGGARVILVDDAPELGGHLRLTSAAVRGDPRLDGLDGIAAAARLRELLAETAGVTVLSEATAFGIYEGGLLAAAQGTIVHRIRARRIVLATGAAERPALFDRNDLPGIMLGSGVLRLARLFGVRAGRRAIVLTDGPWGWRSAVDLLDAGVPVTALLDAREDPSVGMDDSLHARLVDAGVEILVDAVAVSGRGRGRISGLRVRTSFGERTLPTDLVAMCLRPEPVTALAGQAGAQRRWDAALGVMVPDAPPDGVLFAGHVEGADDLATVLASGVLAGRLAVREAGVEGAPDPAPALAALESARASAGEAVAAMPVGKGPGGRKQVVCVCEDVTVKELTLGVYEGFDDLETMKRYSTTTMGPCQGKMCHSLAAGVQAELTGRTRAEVGMTTSRPPYHPVSLAALAGPHLDPVRYTAMHDRHAALDPTWIDMGDWKRPLHYGSVADECRAVRERVGLIDVSTLGKLEVRGADAGEYLDWLHPNRFSDLKVGRVRYRAMTDEAGVVLDDGTVARFEADRFFVSTGTGTLDAVDQWMRWWLAGTGRDVVITNTTNELAAMNLAGPRAREVLERITDADVSKAAMPYLAAAEVRVAGVPATILRIGFVGELGYEIHVPADYGAHVWDALMEAGRDLGIAPFGVEAQRVLRLEKQHLIVSQDTDALSGPIESGLGWLVKADKPDFVGRAAIAHAESTGARANLIGFEAPGRPVPHEGAGIVREGKLIGRVTSAKWSPFLEKTIGMAWMSIGPFETGTPIVIRHDGRTVVATLQAKPFYDPEGVRLRA
ncbi:MAG: 2Fe-2S iron-sulfur cluster-binding protein [Chloroflexota bacterium]